MSQEEDGLKQAIALIKTGKKTEAVPILKSILKTNRNYEPAWLWLAFCVETTDDKIFCFREALRINPNNEQVKKALEQLEPNPTPQPAVEELSIAPSNQNTPGKVEDVQGTTNQKPPPPDHPIQRQKVQVARKMSNETIIIISVALVLLCIFGLIIAILTNNKSLSGTPTSAAQEIGTQIIPTPTNTPIIPVDNQIRVLQSLGYVYDPSMEASCDEPCKTYTYQSLGVVAMVENDGTAFGIMVGTVSGALQDQVLGMTINELYGSDVQNWFTQAIQVCSSDLTGCETLNRATIGNYIVGVQGRISNSSPDYELVLGIKSLE